jgi:hypothetical protein
MAAVSSKKSLNVSSAPNIVVLGPRGSGKTTYLSGLTKVAEAKASEFLKSDKVEIAQFRCEIGEERSRELRQDADNIVFFGDSHMPTTLEKKDDGGIKTYTFTGEISYEGIKDEFMMKLTDTSGEIFETETGVMDSAYRLNLKDRLEGKDIRLLILLADVLPEASNPNPDDKLKYQIEELELVLREVCSEGIKRKLRLAVVINKCERGELWTHRLDPVKDIFGNYLKSSKTNLQLMVSAIKKTGAEVDIDFFAMSTFGVLKKDDFRPNYIYGSDDNDGKFVLRNTDLNEWHPYGVLSPIYWLTTGRRLPHHV